MSSANKPQLTVTQVEDRVVPTTGLAWPGAQNLTLSYIPDGVGVGGQNSNLFSNLNSDFANDTATWKREIARAYHTWAVTANINIGPVADGGQAMGTAGLSQGDSRFGDIRIGGRSLSVDQGDAIATASGFDYSDSTWVGDALISDRFDFVRGNVAGKYDVFSTMIHEAGHSLGLMHSTEPGSVMNDGYSFRTGLSSGDVTNITNLYGWREEDAHEGLYLNETMSTATSLTWTGARQTLAGDIIIAGDIDHYKFRTLASGESNLRIRVRTTGLSFLTPDVKIYRGSTLVAQASTNDPYNGELLISLGSQYVANTEYTVRVTGNGTEVFNRGAYQLILEQTAGSTADPLTPTADNNTNNTVATASSMVNSGWGNYRRAAGIIETSTDVDFFKYIVDTIDPTKILSATVASLTPTTFVPKVTLVNGLGVEIPSVITMNEKGSLTIETLGANLVSNSTVYLRVASMNPSAQATGSYTLTAGIRTGTITNYQSLGVGSVTLASPTQYSKLTVGEARLVRFSLDSTISTGPSTAVGITVFDSKGKKVYSFNDVAGTNLTTASVWLIQGEYTLAITAKTNTNATPVAAAYTLRKRELGNPIDPIADGAGGTTGQDPVVTAGPIVTLPPYPSSTPSPTPGCHEPHESSPHGVGSFRRGNFSPASMRKLSTFCFGAVGQVVNSEKAQGGL